MARKKTAEKKVVSTTSTTEEVLKAVRLELPIDIHRELRVEAAKTDTNMSALARRAVEEMLARRRSGGK
jgi:hypothetical protein